MGVKLGPGGRPGSQPQLGDTPRGRKLSPDRPLQGLGSWTPQLWNRRQLSLGTSQCTAGQGMLLRVPEPSRCWGGTRDPVSSRLGHRPSDGHGQVLALHGSSAGTAKAWCPIHTSEEWTVGRSLGRCLGGGRPSASSFPWASGHAGLVVGPRANDCPQDPAAAWLTAVPCCREGLTPDTQ